jgi:uncharacterized protein YjbI with pentapeptide repeats
MPTQLICHDSWGSRLTHIVSMLLHVGSDGVKAELKGANQKNANLTNARLDGCDLNDAGLTDVVGVKP